MCCSVGGSAAVVLTLTRAIEAVLTAMGAHTRLSDVQLDGCDVLATICQQRVGEGALHGASEPQGRAHAERAADAGAIEAVAGAMRAHPGSVDVQGLGCRALGRLGGCQSHQLAGGRAAALARCRRATDAGAFDLVVAAMKGHRSDTLEASVVQGYGCFALAILCGGYTDAAVEADRGPGHLPGRAVGAGALKVVVAAMRAHPQVGKVQRWGAFALCGMCRGGFDVQARRDLAIQEGAQTVANGPIAIHESGHQPSRTEWANASEHGRALLACLLPRARC